MTIDRSYAAVRLRDDAVAVLWSDGIDVTQAEYRIALSIDAGSPTYLAAIGSGTDRRDGFPVDSIDDEHIVVGSTVVPVDVVLAGIVDSALIAVGADVPTDLLEIACPSAWGSGRRTALREASKYLAREVVVVDTSVVALRSVGERAPESAVVVELSEFGSVVACVSIADDMPAVSGLWDAFGRADLAQGGSDASVTGRVERAVADASAGRSGRGQTDVFVLDTDVAPRLKTLPLGDSCRIQYLSSADIVRSMASRVGISPVADSEQPRRNFPLAEAQVAPRAAAWLAEATYESPRPRSRLPLIAGVGAAVVVLVAATVLWVRADSGSPTAAAVATSVAPPRPSTSDTTTTTTTAALSTTAATRTPVFTGFVFGRARVNLPADWSARDEETRLLLIPPDGPDRRILVTTADLAPGTSIDDVAADLTAQLAARSDEPGSTIETIDPTTDFGSRTGISYVENPGDDSVVRWYVFAERDVQVSIGCQSRTGSEDALERDCAHALDTLIVEPAP